MRRRRAGLAMALALGSGACIAFAGCLDDLDPPLACPPEAKHAAGQCELVFASLAGQPGQCLWMPDQFECLGGPRKTCDCQLGECGTTGATCYPSGDCPPEVTKQVGSTATCVRLSQTDFESGLPQVVSCECGCAGCAAVCDGFGPMVGVWDDGFDHGVPIINVKRHMPDSGRFGLYVRARGLSNATIVVGTGDPNDLTTITWQASTPYLLSTPLDSFAESVFFDQRFVGGNDAYAWSNPDDRPAVVAIVPPKGTKDKPAPSLFEIDCLIPFVLAR